ncbi:bifunctional diaminohydroxyphosphoribosylaminopyrimidine deaminase/5-amino-6-(5-phosphoribosylamino)uracil reductase RibD [Algiphilus sp.]|uniref:bifunctional diaminohydroxyphosphoribosylaminopyrimidine deaminase/5-amino-6-(5-phosphoribosylamino)uracil reductase RibD n=1 Tax=Algiphilus sp. TaxID=1872431 RepID=UPI0032ECCFF4
MTAQEAFTPQDALYMARALRLARRGLGATHPNPAVGCVIVKDGQVLGEGFHARAGEPHAEALALEAAGAAAEGADVYVTLEPCAHTGRTPPCCDALIRARVGRVVAAHVDPDPRTAGGGLARLEANGVQVASGLMAAEARALNRGFVQRLEAGRPFVTLKMAFSLDGRTAMASGESQWITSEAARADGHRARARHHAVLTSAQTVLDDHPRLTVRTGPPGTRQPERIVLDARGRVPADAQVFNDDGVACWWLVGATATVSAPSHVRVCPVAMAGTQLDLAAGLRLLAEAGINDVLVESGPRLAGALLRADLVDELLCYVAPSLLGDDARPLARLPGLEHLAQRRALEWRDVAMVGQDLRIVAGLQRSTTDAALDKE